MLYRDWDALHKFTSYQQIQEWLEDLSVNSHLWLIHFHAAYLNCKLDHFSTFGQAKNAFWNMANTYGFFPDGTFIVKHGAVRINIDLYRCQLGVAVIFHGRNSGY